MKNNRIARAYDSINPSEADKQRMLQAILLDANLQDKPEKPKKAGKEPVVYTARPTKSSKRGVIGALAACLAVFVIGGAVLIRMLGGAPVNPAYDDPTTEATEESTTGVYDEVLARYSQALNEKWSEEQCEMEGITVKFPAIYHAEVSAGFQLLDLNGDGREELVISDGHAVWDLYTTLEDGTPIQLHSAENDGVLCQINEGGIISIELTTKTDAEYGYYRLEDNRLVAEEMILYTDADEQWSRETGEQEWEIISREEASDILYSYEPMELALRYFHASLADVAALELYMLTLEKYKTAYAEGWDRTMCAENGLSVLTSVESENEGLYYTMFDLDGNGTEELIIREFDYADSLADFIDIYTLRDGAVTNIMSRKDQDLLYLYQGGYVQDCTPPEQGKYDAYISFLHLEGSQFEKTGHVYCIDGQWYHGLHADEKITAEEANAELASYKPLNLNYFQISDSSEVEYVTGYAAYDDIVEKYRIAVTIGFTAQQCESGDMSPEIMSSTVVRSDVGWCLMDIDSNGVEELIISDGIHLFDLYVMQPHNGGAAHLIKAGGGEYWQLCENGVLQMHGLYSGTSAWRYYTLSDTDLVQRDMVFYEGSSNQYSYGVDDDSLKPISKDEAGNIIAGERTAELTLTPFIEQPPFEPDEMEYYNPLLERYRQAIREDWNPGVCVEKGISLMVGYYGDFVEELGYTTMDLDSNGIQELIITDGTNIYDLYTIIQDEETGPLRLIDAMERIEYFLTTDGWIYCMGSGSASVSYYTLYSLEGRELKLLEGYMMDYETNPDEPWYYYDGVEQGDPCPREIAVAATDSITFAHIPFTSFE